MIPACYTRAKIVANVPTPICAQKPLAVATPDGGLLYTGFKCINYIPALNATKNDAAEVRTISTRITINGLDVNPMWCKEPTADNTAQLPNHGKKCAIVAEDWSIQVWDCELGVGIRGHRAHEPPNASRDQLMYSHLNVLMSYMINGNILSMDAINLVIYCVASNTYFRRATFLPKSNRDLTALRCSPYDEHLFAVGTSAGAVLVCDLSEMSVVHKLNAHGQHASICGLAWREMSPRHEKLHMDKAEADNEPESWQSSPAIAAPKAPLLKSKAEECDDMFDIYNYDHLESEFGAPAKVRPRRNSKSMDDCGDFVGLEKPSNTVTIDYMEACESMKAELTAHRDYAIDKPQMEVTLQDCQDTGTRGPISEDGSSHDSMKEQHSVTEGSLGALQFSSSSDDAVIVDGEASKPKREVLHHIYHQAEVHDAPESPQLQQGTAEPQTESPTAKLPKETSVDTSSRCSIDASARPEILLATINDNEVIMLWNAVTGEHCAKNYSKINAPSKAKQVHWLNDHTLVSLSRKQLNFWSVAYDEKTRRYKINKDQLHKCSAQDIAACVASAAYPQIWLNTFSRRVLLLNPFNGEASATYSCLAFGVRAVSECPDDMNKIALGCSDKRVAFYDISKQSASCISIDSVFVNSPVYSLAWSKNCLELAYGTFDGIVGILDVDSMRVKTTFRPVQKKEIYSLMWHGKELYYIVNGMVCVVYPERPDIETIQLKHIESSASYLYVLDKYLLVGTRNGFLELYSKSQINGKFLLKSSMLMSNYITDIAFNPLEPNVFALVSHSSVIQVMKLELETPGWSKLHKILDGGTADTSTSVASVKWSNQHAHLLLSCHSDGRVVMWNTKELEQPPLYIRYQCPMWCGIFLPSDEGIIVCSGKTISLELVSIKEALERNEKQILSKINPMGRLQLAFKSPMQPCDSTKSAAQKKRKRRANQQRGSFKQAPEQSYQADTTAKLLDPRPKAEPKIESMLGALSLETKGTNTQSVVVESETCQERPTDNIMPKSSMSHSRTCLCLTQKELNKSALEKLAIVLTEDPAKIDKAVLMSKLFSTKVAAKELVATEMSNLMQSNNKDIAPLNLSVTTYKLRDELEQHVANKTLNEWHVSLAPVVSYVFWQMCCKAYAEQLENLGYVLHAATYMLAVDMQMEAIHMLLKHEYFKEALLNARIHLPATDPIIKTIISKWLEQLEKTGNYAAAALICVLDNEMLRGYLYLHKIRKCTPEIVDLKDQIKRIGQLGPIIDDACPGRVDTLDTAAEEAD